MKPLDDDVERSESSADGCHFARNTAQRRGASVARNAPFTRPYAAKKLFLAKLSRAGRHNNEDGLDIPN